MSPVRVIFVCWGNICRSPIAERVAEKYAAEQGLSDVRFTSAGTSSEELGEPIDPRAVDVLQHNGYRTDDHAAHQIQPEELAEADLVVAMEPLHVDRMRRIGDVDQVALLTDFDPNAAPGSGVPDPWYGGPEGFDTTLAAVEAAMPGILDRVRQLQNEPPGG